MPFSGFIGFDPGGVIWENYLLMINICKHTSSTFYISNEMGLEEGMFRRKKYMIFNPLGVNPAK